MIDGLVQVARRSVVPKVLLVEGFLRPWFVPLLFAFAAAYYALYFHDGLNLGGEGGTTAVLAMRLMEGYRPIVDTFLGYNLLWFAPVMGLFEITGPNYLVMKGFFFFLCALSGVLGALTVWRLGHSALLALICGMILILIPGMLFRNYMGFLGVVNQLSLLSAFLLPVSRPAMRPLLIGVSGFVLGLTFLIRIEVGLLMTVMWLGLGVLFLCWRGEFFARLRQLSFGVPLAILLFVATHLPFALDAKSRGYETQFWGQYGGLKKYMLYLLDSQLQMFLPSEGKSPEGAALPRTGVPRSRDLDLRTVVNAEDARKASDANSAPVEIWRPRPPVHQIWTGVGQRERYFASAVFFPVVFSAAVAGVAGMVFFLGYWRRSLEMRDDALKVLTLVGCSLALFPQYFFFRPDTPHITEFMIPFVVAMIGTFALLLRRCMEGGTTAGRGLLFLCCVVCVITVWVHFGHAWPKESAGTIAAKVWDGERFEGLNGVHAQVPAERAAELRLLLEAVTQNSRPEDWVICIPYSPTINLMTDRRSYLWNLYMDDSNRHGDFQDWQVAQIEKFQPKVIVVDHRAINQTESSRFRNWAPRIYAHILQHYKLVTVADGNEVFVRKSFDPAGDI